MYEKIKSWIYNNHFLVGMGVGAVLLLNAYLYGGENAGTGDNVAGTIQRVKDDNKRAGDLADDARREITAVRADVARAIANAERAKGIATQNTGTIKECRDIVDALKNRTRQAKSIFADIEQGNKEGKSSS